MSKHRTVISRMASRPRLALWERLTAEDAESAKKNKKKEGKPSAGD